MMYSTQNSDAGWTSFYEIQAYPPKNNLGCYPLSWTESNAFKKFHNNKIYKSPEIARTLTIIYFSILTCRCLYQLALALDCFRFNQPALIASLPQYTSDVSKPIENPTLVHYTSPKKAPYLFCILNQISVDNPQYSFFNSFAF